MAVEISSNQDRLRLSPISWPAVFASLAVGISVMLLLSLAGVAVGVSVVDPGADNPRAITIGAATWQTFSMLVAAIVGGYVAARLSGLRRTADGVLHGAVSWGATTVLYAALATTALGTLTAGMFGLLAAGTPERAATAAAPALGNRDEAQRTLESVGLTPEHARIVIEQLTASAGAPASAPLERRPAAEDAAAGSVGTATGWLSATVLLSLLLSLLGGAMGARAARRGNRRLEQRETATTAFSGASEDTQQAGLKFVRDTR